ncbi:MAG: response regulator [Fibrobacteres bacterium]|nr:response regulator [Fibrobacterota bacterium]
MSPNPESLLDSIFRGLPDPVLVMRGSRVEMRNPAALSMELGELQGEDLVTFVCPDHRASLLELLGSEGAGCAEIEFLVQSGTCARWRLSSGSLDSHPDLKLIVATPVTVVAEEVEALHAVLSQAGSILWHARVRVAEDRFVWDLHLVNEDVANRLLHLEILPGERFHHAWYRSRDPDEILACDQRSEEAMRQGISHYRQEFRCRDLEGNWKWFTEDVDLRGNMEDGFSVTGVCMEISDRVKMGLELEAALQEATLASRAKGDFLASMSHEIRTPMNAILGMTELLRQTELSVDQCEMVETAHDAGSALLSILDEILDMAKIEAGRLELREAPFDLRELVEKVVGLFAAVGQARGVDLLWRWDPGTFRQVRGDEGRVRQILSNIVGNASKFTERGIVCVRVHARRTRKPGRAVFSLEVSDTGPGISAEGLTRLFHPFMQIGGRTARTGGTGLGLTISRRLAMAMNGDIQVRSVLGKGSVFRVDLELGIDTEVPMRPCGKTVLVHSPSREVVRSLLDACACVGVEAIAFNRAVPLDLPVDVALVDLECRMELEKIVATWPGARIVAIVRSAPGTNGKHQLPIPVRLSTLARLLELDGDSGPDSTVRQDPSQFPESLEVLVADDNPVNRRVIQRQLQSMGLVPTVVDGGEAALRCLLENRFDIAFLDMQMPDLDGHLVAKRLRELDGEQKSHRIPLVALSASVLPEDREACLGAGMDAFVAKPASRQDLAAAIHRFTGLEL